MKKIALFLLVPLLSSCAPSQVPAPVYTIEEVPTLDSPATYATEKTPALIVEKPELKVVLPDEHTIQEGETLAQIAFDYGLDYKELALWNGISNPDEIYAGNALDLSPPENAPKVATVKPTRTAALEPTLRPTLSPTESSTPPSTSPSTTKPVAPSTAPSTSSTPQPATPTTPPTQSVVVGGPTQPSAAAIDAPIKEQPLAGKYAYSSGDLEKLRAEWQAASTPPIPASPPPSAETAPPAVTQTVAVAPTDVRRRFDVDWSWPATGKVTDTFSESSKGINIAGQKGDDIFASADGQVVYVGTGVKSYGRLVILKHHNDYLSAYAHNDQIIVKEGQRVARGEKISTMGDSGTSRVMLHLEIRKSGKPFDPMQVLPPKP